MSIHKGDRASDVIVVTADMIRDFALLSGDTNPIHSDPAAAAVSRFGRVIAPGILTASFVSALIANRLPGPGTIYVSQTLQFRTPVFVNDRILVSVEVTEIDRARNRAWLATTVTCAERPVLTGLAEVLLPSMSGG